MLLIITLLLMPIYGKDCKNVLIDVLNNDLTQNTSMNNLSDQIIKAKDKDTLKLLLKIKKQTEISVSEQLFALKQIDPDWEIPNSVINWYKNKINQIHFGLPVFKKKHHDEFKNAFNNDLYQKFFIALEKDTDNNNITQYKAGVVFTGLDLYLLTKSDKNIKIPPAFIEIIDNSYILSSINLVLAHFFDLKKEKRTNYANVLRYMIKLLSMRQDQLFKTPNYLKFFTYLKYHDYTKFYQLNFDTIMRPFKTAIQLYKNYTFDYYNHLRKMKRLLDKGQGVQFEKAFNDLQIKYPNEFAKYTLSDLVSDLFTIENTWQNRLEDSLFDDFFDKGLYLDWLNNDQNQESLSIRNLYLRKIIASPKHLNGEDAFFAFTNFNYSYNGKYKPLFDKILDSNRNLSIGDRLLLEAVKINPSIRFPSSFILKVNNASLFKQKKLKLVNFFDLTSPTLSKDIEVYIQLLQQIEGKDAVSKENIAIILQQLYLETRQV